MFPFIPVSMPRRDRPWKSNIFAAGGHDSSGGSRAKKADEAKCQVEADLSPAVLSCLQTGVTDGP